MQSSYTTTFLVSRRKHVPTRQPKYCRVTTTMKVWIKSLEAFTKSPSNHIYSQSLGTMALDTCYLGSFRSIPFSYMVSNLSEEGMVMPCNLKAVLKPPKTVLVDLALHPLVYVSQSTNLASFSTLGGLHVWPPNSCQSSQCLSYDLWVSLASALTLSAPIRDDACLHEGSPIAWVAT